MPSVPSFRCADGMAAWSASAIISVLWMGWIVNCRGVYRNRVTYIKIHA